MIKQNFGPETIKSPVLVPFGHDSTIIRTLVTMGKEIYIAPQYKFWGKAIETLVKNYPTRYTLDYIKEKINTEYTGVVTKSKYRFLFENLFNKETAEFVDKIYQMDFDQKEKDIIIFLLTYEIERHADDLSKFKKTILNLDVLNDIFENLLEYFDFLIDFRNIKINIVKEELTNQKFVAIVDSVYRKSRIYTPQYLGFVSVFTGVKERLSSWEKRLEHVAHHNLIHGGRIYIPDYPSEYAEKINKILRKLKYKKEDLFIWRKPDIKVNKITKGIKRYF